ncbi:MAG: succinate dehydrogenase/fumarate reductase cytochrome b subunit [Desulfovibrio sp.]|nr:MAG: succinate dehydrogenase/fumarate reductase cytochrome b subunit [Desulfovibrio sp.]
MPLEATAPLAKPGRAAAYLDWLQMLTGAFLILFMWGHLLMVSSVLFGRGAMNGIAGFLETTGLAQLGGPVIAVAFLLHFVLAARKIPFTSKEQRTAVGHAKMLHHTDTWLWIVQVVSAMVILVLGSIHMWTVLTDLYVGVPGSELGINAETSAARVQKWPWTLLYIVLLPLAELHVSIGFYRIGVKWGVIKRKGRKKAKLIEYIMAGAFLLIGTATLIRFLLMDVN